MSYSVDELFEIRTGINTKEKDAWVYSFLKGDDPAVTRVEIPAEYNGYRIEQICAEAFFNSPYLREVIIPDSVWWIGPWAFGLCPELRTVRLPNNGHCEIYARAFADCPKLDPEVVMKALIESPEDISKPFNDEPACLGDDEESFSAEEKLDWKGLMRPEVFELAVKYDSFRLIGTEMLCRVIVYNGLFEHFGMLENAGRSPDAEQTDRLIEFSSENVYTEMTAFLLDYKNRKFGFNGGDDFEL